MAARVVVAAPPQFLKKGRAWRRRLGPPDGGGLCRKGRRAFGPRVVDSPAGNAYEVSVTGMPFCHICHSKHGGKSATSGGFPPARQGGCLVFTNWRPSFLKAPTTTLTPAGRVHCPLSGSEHNPWHRGPLGPMDAIGPSAPKAQAPSGCKGFIHTGGEAAHLHLPFTIHHLPFPQGVPHSPFPNPQFLVPTVSLSHSPHSQKYIDIAP